MPKQIITIVWGMSYSLTILFAKMSLFLLYLRIFIVNRAMKWAIYAGMVAVIGFYVATGAYFGYACLPRQDETWLLASLSTRCHDVTVLELPMGIFGLISDLYLYFLPIPIIIRLNFGRRKKLGTLAIFGTGSLYVDPFEPSIKLLLKQSEP